MFVSPCINQEVHGARVYFRFVSVFYVGSEPPCRRVYHNAFVLALWTFVWFLGTYPLGRPLSEGWRFAVGRCVATRLKTNSCWTFNYVD